MNAPAEPPPAKRRRPRRALRVAGAVVLGLAALAVVLYAAAGPLLGTAVEAAGGKLLDVPVSVASVRVRLAGGVQTAGLSVGNPSGFEDPTAFHCDGLVVATAVTALLRNPVEVQELTVRRPEVTLEVSEGKIEGRRANWTVLLQRLKAAGEEAKKRAPGAAEPKAFVIRRIRLLESRIRFRAPVVAPEGVVVELNDIDLDRVGNAPGTRSTPDLVLAAVLQALFGGKAREDGLPGPVRSSVRSELKEAAGAVGKLLEGP